MKKTPFKLFVCITALLIFLTVQTSCKSDRQSSLANSKRDMVLWYKQPGEKWLEGLPIGNGYMGAMVFGRVQNERIALNEGTFWSGRPHDYTNPEGYKYFPMIRDLVFAGKYKEAEKTANEHFFGIRMEGPYCWRPPSYWFSGKYPAICGSTVEQGDNEQIPTLESLKKFIPEDKLWPINDTWFMHAGAWAYNSTLGNIQLALEKRYGPSSNVEDFVRKAQLAHYENARAQFESFAACGWATHKMTAYWMLNSHWPSFYGNLIGYYLSPGGVYFGAKKGLRPLSVVFDSYATGDNSLARIIVFNQTPGDVHGLRVRVRVYDLDGKVRDDRSANGISVPYNGTNQVMLLPRYAECSPVFFVRCQLFDDSGKLLVDNTYWKSQKDDDLGPRTNDIYMTLKQEKWSDMTALNNMPAGNVEIEAQQKKVGAESHVTIRLHNPSGHIAFFERATISEIKEGNEILPIKYDDNYVTIFPGETVEIHGIVRKGVEARWVKLEGYNTPAISVPIK